MKKVYIQPVVSEVKLNPMQILAGSIKYNPNKETNKMQTIDVDFDDEYEMEDNDFQGQFRIRH